ncbi:hypothetical protein JTE90_014245 [Oedothorax gibbosus]|uniref:Uncharacterized protein n=1 Tax=Oedothorax gibbosus TaxID=931172 RepID=A0AAV6U8S6_9ARAC|nr:hypothetical protein JTE90_014245 [Oedothorax gibbosus]
MNALIGAILIVCTVLLTTTANVILEGLGTDEISGYILSPVTGISKIHLNRKFRRQVNLHIPLIPYVEDGKKKAMPVKMSKSSIPEDGEEVDADGDVDTIPMGESFFQIDDTDEDFIINKSITRSVFSQFISSNFVTIAEMKLMISLILLCTVLTASTAELLQKNLPTYLTGLQGLGYHPKLPLGILGFRPSMLYGNKGLSPNFGMIKLGMMPEKLHLNPNVELMESDLLIEKEAMGPTYGDMEKMVGYGGLLMPYGGYGYPMLRDYQ